MPRTADPNRAARGANGDRHRIDAYVSGEMRRAVYGALEDRNHGMLAPERITLSRIVEEALTQHPDVARALQRIRGV